MDIMDKRESIPSISNLRIYTTYFGFSLYLFYGVMKIFFKSEKYLFIALGILATINLFVCILLWILNREKKEVNFEQNSRPILLTILANLLAVVLSFHHGGLY